MEKSHQTTTSRHLEHMEDLKGIPTPAIHHNSSTDNNSFSKPYLVDSESSNNGNENDEDYSPPESPDSSLGSEKQSEQQQDSLFEHEENGRPVDDGHEDEDDPSLAHKHLAEENPSASEQHLANKINNNGEVLGILSDNYDDDDDDDDYEPEESKDYDDVDFTIGRASKSQRDYSSSFSKSRKRKSSSLTSSKSSTKTKMSEKDKKKKVLKKPRKNKKASIPKNQESSISTSKKSSMSIEESTTSDILDDHQYNLSLSIGSSKNFRHLLTPNEHKFEQIFPPELLIRLFQSIIDCSQEDPIQTLIRLSQVCERWRQLIITTPTLWSRIDLSSMSETRFSMERFRRLHQEHRLFQSVRHVDLSNWKGEMAKKMLEFLTDCSQYDLHSLSIRRCRNISAPFLKTVVANAGNLRTLNISGITSSQHHYCQNPFQTTTFKPLIERCGESLRALYMSENMIASSLTCFSIVLEYCPNLQVLDISNVSSLGSRCSTMPIERFQQSCPQIRVLRAANVCFHPSSCPTSGWPYLEELSIPFNVGYMVSAGHNDQIIEQLTKSSENLTLLDIRGSPGTTPRGLVKIPAWSLKHLSISNCPKMQDETLGMVFQKWNSSLIDVDLSWNKSESCIDECVRSICDVPTEEIKLKTIDLRGSAISLETLRRLILHCGDHLQSIDLQSCRSLPRGMKRLFQGEEYQRLRQQIMLDVRCD